MLQKKKSVLVFTSVLVHYKNFESALASHNENTVYTLLDIVR